MRYGCLLEAKLSKLERELKIAELNNWEFDIKVLKDEIIEVEREIQEAYEGQEVNISRLEEVLELRKQIQKQYLEAAQEIWNSNLEASKKDSKVRKEYNTYRDKDRILERLQAMEESILEDLEYYYRKYK